MLSEFARKLKILLYIKSNIYKVIDIDKKFLEYNRKIINYKIKEI